MTLMIMVFSLSLDSCVHDNVSPYFLPFSPPVLQMDFVLDHRETRLANGYFHQVKSFGHFVQKASMLLLRMPRRMI